MNRVQLLGRLGADPGFHTTTRGDRIAVINIACNDRYKDAQGRPVERVTWVRCVAFNGLVNVIDRLCRKGTLVHAEGQLRNRVYETNGTKHYAYDVILGGAGYQFRALSDMRDDEPSAPPAEQPPPPSAAGSLDEDIPF